MMSDRDFIPPLWKMVYLLSLTLFFGVFSSMLTYIAVMALSFSEGPLKWRTILLIWGMLFIALTAIMGRSFTIFFFGGLLTSLYPPICWFIGTTSPNIELRTGKMNPLTILFASNTPTNTSDSSV